MFNIPVEATITGVDEFSVEYHTCGSHQMSITFKSYHPYDLARELRAAAQELEQNFEASR